MLSAIRMAENGLSLCQICQNGLISSIHACCPVASTGNIMGGCCSKGTPVHDEGLANHSSNDVLHCSLGQIGVSCPAVQQRQHKCTTSSRMGRIVS